MYDVIIKAKLLHNTEVWSNVSKQEMAKMEKIQKEVLYYLFDMKLSTPYEGVLSALGIRRVEHEIVIRKLMLPHQLLNSNDSRIAKQVLEEQMVREGQGTWYDEVGLLGEVYTISVI